MSRDYQRDWPRYFDAVEGKPARDTLLRALDLFETLDTKRKNKPVQRMALDIGCGQGRDMKAMLARRGPTRWRVIGFDTSAEGLKRVAKNCGKTGEGERWGVIHASMEDLARVFKRDRGMDASVDLVNASFALPFCQPGSFPELWRWLGRVLKPGGRFAGQFFGDRDEWAIIRPESHKTLAQVKRLLRGFVVEWLEEVEKDGDDAMGGLKHHHVFHVVARKRRA